MSNLPKWPGASAVYSKAYRLLEGMARNGHAKAPRRGKRGKVLERYPVSDEMTALVDALDAGDEAQLKWLLLNYADRGLGE